MSATLRRLAPPALLAAVTLVLTACGSVNSAGNRLTDAITPYRIEVVQGNFVSKEQVQALSPGMGRNQVRDILGTPLMTSLFHADRWDYVFTIRRQGVAPQSRRLTLFFKDDELQRFEGDEMPSEAEFVAQLDVRTKKKPPVLEASEDALKPYEPKAGRSAAKPAEAPAAPTQYPPLEPAR